MRWIRVHKTATAIAFILTFLMIVTIVSYVHKGNDSWLGRTLGSAITFVQQPLATAGNGVSDAATGIFRFRTVMEENNELKDKVAELEFKLTDQALTAADLEELRSLSQALNYVKKPTDYKWVAANVIAMDGSQWFKIFTINAGEKQGIVKDAIVINGNGLIGKIFEIGPNWAKVISIIDGNNHVSFKVNRDLSLLGILYGDGKGGLTGYMLSPEASVIKGDTLITSGMEMYPEGIPIGKIDQVSWDTNALLRTVRVQPMVSFENISKVMVVNPIAGQAEE